MLPPLPEMAMLRRPPRLLLPLLLLLLLLPLLLLPLLHPLPPRRSPRKLLLCRPLPLRKR